MSDVDLDEKHHAPRRFYRVLTHLQGYLAQEKPSPTKSLPQAYAYGPRGVLGGCAFFYERGTPVRNDVVSGYGGIVVDCNIFVGQSQVMVGSSASGNAWELGE